MNDKLSALEWSVVALARGDRLSSLQAPGKFSTFLKRLFEGERPSPAFADKRLEALRTTGGVGGGMQGDGRQDGGVEQGNTG